MKIVELARERCVVCLSSEHRLAAQDTAKVEQILDEPFIAAPSNGKWRDYRTANDYRLGRPAHIVHEAATVDVELQAVATRKGISITAESTAKYYSRPSVIFRPIEDMADCAFAIGFRDGSNALVRDMVLVAKEVANRHFSV